LAIIAVAMHDDAWRYYAEHMQSRGESNPDLRSRKIDYVEGPATD